MDTKQCNKCKEVKPLSDFSKNKNSKDGYQYVCKTCSSAAKKAWKKANKEKVAAYDKQWKKDNRDKVLAYAAQWQKDNPEKVSIKNKKWRDANPEKERARSNAVKSRRRVRLKGNTDSSACPKLIQFIYANCPEGYHVDHFYPIALGGSDHHDNLCYLPIKDNLSKGGKPPGDCREQLDQLKWPLVSMVG